MAHIRQADSDKDRATIKALFQEYLAWVFERIEAGYGYRPQFTLDEKVEQDVASMIEAFLPPSGRLLLAFEEVHSAGIGCLRRIQENTGEIKRMYVRPEFRGRGIGRALLKALVSEAHEMGYLVVRLDSASFMEAAHSLYRSAGFNEIGPYQESEIPLDLRHSWRFMEKQL